MVQREVTGFRHQPEASAREVTTSLMFRVGVGGRAATQSSSGDTHIRSEKPPSPPSVQRARGVRHHCNLVEVAISSTLLNGPAAGRTPPGRPKSAFWLPGGSRTCSCSVRSHKKAGKARSLFRWDPFTIEEQCARIWPESGRIWPGIVRKTPGNGWRNTPNGSAQWAALQGNAILQGKESG